MSSTTVNPNSDFDRNIKFGLDQDPRASDVDTFGRQLQPIACKQIDGCIYCQFVVNGPWILVRC